MSKVSEESVEATPQYPDSIYRYGFFLYGLCSLRRPNFLDHQYEFWSSSSASNNYGIHSISSRRTNFTNIIAYAANHANIAKGHHATNGCHPKDPGSAHTANGAPHTTNTARNYSAAASELANRTYHVAANAKHPYFSR
ncbi:hypothetical protein NL676_038903 [Syzygium grande]|nr:hypothetical protein NL676_038903 [Syzygium grande]